MLSYTEYGSGPAVILLHGLLGSKANMTGIARSLAVRFHTFAVDLRNHGDSFHHGSMTYRTMAADLGGFMDDQDLDSAAVIGHSMGGKCAMQLALSFPERIDKLVVVDIAPKAYKDPSWAVYLRAMQVLDLDHLGSRKEADRLLQSAIPNPVYRQFLLANLEADRVGSYRWKPDLHAISAAQNAISAGIDGPPCEVETLFIRGQESTYILEDDRDQISRLFPNSRLVTIPGASHLVHIEAREPFLRIVGDFL